MVRSRCERVGRKGVGRQAGVRHRGCLTTCDRVLAGKMGRLDGVPALSKSVESKHVLQPMRMKTSPFTLLLALLLLAVPSTQAQQYYLNLTASYKSTNSAGALVTTKMSAPSLLIEILRDT